MSSPLKLRKIWRSTNTPEQIRSNNSASLEYEGHVAVASALSQSYIVHDFEERGLSPVVIDSETFEGKHPTEPSGTRVKERYESTASKAQNTSSKVKHSKSGEFFALGKSPADGDTTCLSVGSSPGTACSVNRQNSISASSSPNAPKTVTSKFNVATELWRSFMTNRTSHKNASPFSEVLAAKYEEMVVPGKAQSNAIMKTPANLGNITSKLAFESTAAHSERPTGESAAAVLERSYSPSVSHVKVDCSSFRRCSWSHPEVIRTPSGNKRNADNRHQGVSCATANLDSGRTYPQIVSDDYRRKTMDSPFATTATSSEIQIVGDDDGMYGTRSSPTFQSNKVNDRHDSLPIRESSTTANSVSNEPTCCQGSPPLCQCPCRNCSACPIRRLRKRETRRLKHFDGFVNYDESKSYMDTSTSGPAAQGLAQSKLVTAASKTLYKVLNLEVEYDPLKYPYDVNVIPEEPLGKAKQRLLEITELPFLILWVYLTYWLVIVSLTASKSPSTVWLSAAVAGLLVGVGLNANAYKAVSVPLRRGSVRYHRHARALMDLRRYGGDISTIEMKVDWGMVIRFFLIPFGVSVLSGLTNSNREDFKLVFPKDPYQLTLAICSPAAVVTTVFVLRMWLLWNFKIRWSVKALFFNGALVD